MQLRIIVNLENAAFEGDTSAEVARVLRQVEGFSFMGPDACCLRDSNGNAAGTARIVDEAKELQTEMRIQAAIANSFPGRMSAREVKDFAAHLESLLLEGK